MSAEVDTYLPAAPQTGRIVEIVHHTEDDQTGLWSQMLSVFRDISGTFDPFANDGDQDVRALGRTARQRRHPQPDDYFALGDLCARLTFRSGQLSETYSAKTIAAYTRAAEIAPAESRIARVALLTYAQWMVDVARVLGGYDALKAAALTCERVAESDLVEQKPAEVTRLHEQTQRLHEQMARFNEDDDAAPIKPGNAENESRLFTDQGQMLLRQSQPKEAFALFERAIQANQSNHAAWLWRAMALTDMARFNDALASYDRALALDGDNARVWNSKGALLTELGRADEALACLNRALELSASDAKVKAIFWLNKGKALFILKRYREAREALVRSYQFDPGPESAAGIAACREQMDVATSQEGVAA